MLVVLPRHILLGHKPSSCIREALRLEIEGIHIVFDGAAWVVKISRLSFEESILRIRLHDYRFVYLICHLLLLYKSTMIEYETLDNLVLLGDDQRIVNIAADTRLDGIVPASD